MVQRDRQGCKKQLLLSGMLTNKAPPSHHRFLSCLALLLIQILLFPKSLVSFWYANALGKIQLMGHTFKDGASGVQKKKRTLRAASFHRCILNARRCWITSHCMQDALQVGSIQV